MLCCCVIPQLDFHLYTLKWRFTQSASHSNTRYSPFSYPCSSTSCAFFWLQLRVLFLFSLKTLQAISTYYKRWQRLHWFELRFEKWRGTSDLYAQSRKANPTWMELRHERPYVEGKREDAQNIPPMIRSKALRMNDSEQTIAFQTHEGVSSHSMDPWDGAQIPFRSEIKRSVPAVSSQQSAAAAVSCGPWLV